MLFVNIVYGFFTLSPFFFFFFFFFFFLFIFLFFFFFFFSSRRRHTRLTCDWSSDVCSSDLSTASWEKMPANFFSQLAVLWKGLPTTNPVALTIGLSCLLLIVIWPRPQTAHPGNWRFITAKMPSTVAVLALSAFAVWALDLHVETLGSRFGELPRGLPTPALPRFDWATAQNLFASTVAIALLGAIESLLCARVADGLIGDRHDPNQELMAQGLANFAAPLFGGIAVTGTIARTMTNVKSGAHSP